QAALSHLDDLTDAAAALVRLWDFTDL
ncbi:MAG: hypothetical protein JWR24_517, partial [Actinoallomurus sp.]|nr:hypothetical protein [Actinoallomurus sp.]